MFEKTLSVLKEKKERKTRLKKELQKQRASLKETSLYQAKLSQLLKEINMILENCPDVESCSITTDKTSELIMDEFRYGKELSDYVVNKKGLEYELSLAKIEL